MLFSQSNKIVKCLLYSPIFRETISINLSQYDNYTRLTNWMLHMSHFVQSTSASRRKSKYIFERNERTLDVSTI